MKSALNEAGTKYTAAKIPRGGGGTRWGQDRRLEFIEFRLLWEGRINRGELVKFFGISIQQASLDISRYLARAKNNLRYDRKRKLYCVTNTFKPVYVSDDSKSFLDQLLGLTIGTLPTAQSFIGWRPPCDVVQFPARLIRPDLLIGINRAIRDGLDIEIVYQSLRRDSATRRWVAPHAIAFDGTRWHVRAWCHENHDFRDFVVTRVQRIIKSRNSRVDAAEDARWHTFTSVVLRPKARLTEAQQLAVAAEFGMKNGLLKLSVREALVYYFVRSLQLDERNIELIRGQPIEIVNGSDIEPLLIEAAKH